MDVEHAWRASPSRSDYDAVVVGSGPNGLAAAVTLARAGRSVLVLEAEGQIGGGTRSAELTLPGFVHDVCSAIHPLAFASPFLRTLPLSEFGLDWVHPEAPFAHPLPDGTAVLCENSLEETARGLGSDGAAWRQLFQPFVEHAEQLFVQALAPLHLPGRPVLMARFGLKAMRSVSGLAGSHFAGERAAALFAGLGAHSVLPLDQRLSAAVAMMLGIAAHAGGWPMPRGGAGQIALAMAHYLESLGAEIATKRRVTSLAEIPPAKAVLFDLAPRNVSRIAGDALPAAYRRKLERFRHGPGVFKLDWALDGPIPWRAEECRRAGTVHVGGTLEEIAAAERAPWEGQHADRPFLLVAQQSLFDPTRAPPGRQTAWAYCHVPHGSKLDMVGRIESQIERFAPGFRERIFGRHAMGPADLERRNANLIGGDISGGVMDLGQLFARPVSFRNPYQTAAPNIFICSSSTPPGPGVHGMCGFHAAQAALRTVLR